MHTKKRSQRVQHHTIQRKQEYSSVPAWVVLQKGKNNAVRRKGGSNPASAARPMPCAHVTLRTKGLPQGVSSCPLVRRGASCSLQLAPFGGGVVESQAQGMDQTKSWLAERMRACVDHTMVDVDQQGKRTDHIQPPERHHTCLLACRSRCTQRSDITHAPAGVISLLPTVHRSCHTHTGRHHPHLAIYFKQHPTQLHTPHHTPHHTPPHQHTPQHTTHHVATVNSTTAAPAQHHSN